MVSDATSTIAPDARSTIATLPATAPAASRPVTAERATAVAWPVLALLLAATCVVVGVIWDISWHMSIGSDAFWTPAHLSIYVGAGVAGLASGILVLKTTFVGSPHERASAVRFWGFRGPLGAWVSIWGATAMIASVPLDDWWHKAFGFDVAVLSPPHAVLNLGMVGVALGAMLLILAHQNRADPNEYSASWLYTYAAGCVLSILAIAIAEYSYAILQHTVAFYVAASLALPLFLVAAGNASRLRWGATAIAGTYMAISLVMLWILPLFAAEPRVSPIYQPITHMVPMEFPLLLIVPAFALDLVRHRMPGAPAWRLTIAQGLAFFLTFAVAQWFFASFLLSPAARNAVFGMAEVPFYVPNTSPVYRREFVTESQGMVLWSGMARAAAYAMACAAVGVAWSRWLKRVVR